MNFIPAEAGIQPSIPPFNRQLKRLAKKYPSLKQEYAELLESLKEQPEQGKFLGNSCYKIRLAIDSQRKGKRGGARLITNFVVKDAIVYLLSIYSKSEKGNLTNKELNEVLKYIPE